MMSISPDAGQGPYVSSTGSIQIEGHNQSPWGSFATTSTLPYWMLWLCFVEMRALMTGLITTPAVSFETAPQPEVELDAVQPVMLYV